MTRDQVIAWVMLRTNHDDQSRLAMALRFDSNIKRLVQAVERHADSVGGTLTQIKDKYYSAMSSYMHGGYMQAVRRIGEDEIAADLFDDGERAEMANFSHTWPLAGC